MTNHDELRKLAGRALERPGMALAERLLRGRPGSVVVDVGANVGGYLVNWFEWGASQVHAFEPVPRVFNQLHDRWVNRPGVTLHQVALSDHRDQVLGVRVFNCHTLAPGNWAGNLGMDLALEDTGPFDMEVRTLDSYSVHWPRVDFIKLDVDGWEPAALRGMEGTLSRFNPPVMLELSYLPRKLGESCEGMVTWLYDRGYKVCTMSGEVCADSTWVMEAFPWRTSFDVMAVHESKIGRDWPVLR